MRKWPGYRPSRFDCRCKTSSPASRKLVNLMRQSLPHRPQQPRPVPPQQQPQPGPRPHGPPPPHASSLKSIRQRRHNARRATSPGWVVSLAVIRTSRVGHHVARRPLRNGRRHRSGIRSLPHIARVFRYLAGCRSGVLAAQRSGQHARSPVAANVNRHVVTCAFLVDVADYVKVSVDLGIVSATI